MNYLKRFCHNLDVRLMGQLGLPVNTKYKYDKKKIIITTFTCCAETGFKEIGSISVSAQYFSLPNSNEVEELMENYIMTVKLQTLLGNDYES
jgi:hypothetical protein